MSRLRSGRRELLRGTCGLRLSVVVATATSATCVRVDQGPPYARFRRSLEIGKLPKLQLDDALEVLALMADQSPPDRYSAAAARWCGRLAVEKSASLSDLK